MFTQLRRTHSRTESTSAFMALSCVFSLHDFLSRVIVSKEKVFFFVDQWHMIKAIKHSERLDYVNVESISDGSLCCKVIYLLSFFPF
jgi:hypothetical protein